MKKKKISKPLPQKPMVKRDSTIPYSLILLAYLILPLITPNFYTLDTAGVKFLVISIINIVSFTIIINSSDYKKKAELQSGYFSSFIGMAFSLLMIVSLLSFSVIINLGEAIMTFSKLFSVFAASYILYIIFSSNRKYLNFIAITLSFILLTDNLSVFYHTLNYIAGDLSSIMDIKTVYSHKNILASAMFIKIPAALYLVFFTQGWQKILGYVSGLTAVLATLLLSTRAFYLGLVFLLMGLLAYAALRFLATRKKGLVIVIAKWVGMFILAVVLYTVAQKFLFPNNKDSNYNVSITSRLSSINDEIKTEKVDESSALARLFSWKRTIKMISQHPLIGVGTGNWKIQVLKWENPSRGDFVYMCKNHNDFLEYTAETGILGGLAFISIFVFILLGFARSCLKADTEESKVKYLFLPAFGLLAYSVDAFFNFPADRPEIQTLFAMYVALGITAYNADSRTEGHSATAVKLIDKLSKKVHPTIFSVCIYILLILASWFLFINTKSLRYQRIFKQDLVASNMGHSSQEMLAGFPGIPNVTIEGEPIAVAKARYLINEKLYREAVNLLLADHASPYDSRREFFLTMAYDLMGNKDSALYYARIAHKLKPLNASAVNSLSALLWSKGLDKEANQVMDTLLQKVKDNTESWVRVSNYQFVKGNYKGAMAILDTALKYNPNDTSLIKKKEKVDYNMKKAPFEELYNKATKAFTEKRYPECLSLLNEFISKQPDLAEAFSLRSYCYFELKQYDRSINDVNTFLEKGGSDYFFINLRGIDYNALGKREQACQDFKTAMEHGNDNAAVNFNKYCVKQ